MKKYFNNLFNKFAVALVSAAIGNKDIREMITEEVLEHRDFSRGVTHEIEEALDNFQSNFEIEADSIRYLDQQLESYIETYFHDQDLPTDGRELEANIHQTIEQLLMDKTFREEMQLPALKEPAVYDPELDGIYKDTTSSEQSVAVQ